MQRQYDHDHLIRVHVRRALDLIPPAADEDARMARLAYITYGACVNGLNHRGEPMPRWDDLPAERRAAWEAAAMAVSMAARLPDAPGWLVPAEGDAEL